MISIIVPHFNRLELLERTIQSVVDQTSTNWELIIVDDGSDANIYEELCRRQYPDNIRILQRTRLPKGPATCRNIGALYATGNYLLFLDSDDLLAPFCLEQRERIMMRPNAPDIAVFRMEEFEVQPGDSARVYNKDCSENRRLSYFFRNENPWNVTGPIWAKQIFLDLGGFDENFLFMEDPELHVRAITSGAKIECFYQLPVDCYYRINYFDNSKKNFYYNSIYFRILFFKKILTTYSTTFILQYKKDMKKGIYRLLKNFLYHRIKEYPDLFSFFTELINNSILFSPTEKNIYLNMIRLGHAKSRLLRVFKIKGMIYHLLPG